MVQALVPVSLLLFVVIQHGMCNVSDIFGQSVTEKAGRHELLNTAGNSDRVARQMLSTLEHSRKARIVGGTKAVEGEFPWQVAVLYLSFYRCGATLIDPQWVLTAAHCFDTLQSWPDFYQLIIGRTSYKNAPKTHKFGVSAIIIHPDYENVTYSNDIALIQLCRPVNVSSVHAQTAYLPSTDDVFSGRTCKVSGWGITAEKKKVYETVLRKTTLKIQRPLSCRRSQGKYYRPFQLCAGWADGRTDTCTGDSGGPLVCPQTSMSGNDRQKTRWTLAGVVSLGSGCGRKGKFGLYTKVQNYLPWINDAIASRRDQSLGCDHAVIG